MSLHIQELETNYIFLRFVSFKRKVSFTMLPIMNIYKSFSFHYRFTAAATYLSLTMKVLHVLHINNDDNPKKMRVISVSVSQSHLLHLRLIMMKGSLLCNHKSVQDSFNEKLLQFSSLSFQVLFYFYFLIIIKRRKLFYRIRLRVTSLHL